MTNIEHTIRVFNLNCNGLGNSLKRSSVFSWISANHKCITFVQETHSTEAAEPDLNKNDYKIWYSHGTSRAQGICTMVPDSYSHRVVDKISDQDGRFFLLHILVFINDSEFVLVNLYAPTKDNPEEQKCFLSFVREHLYNFLDKKIIGGKLNTYMNPAIVKKEECVRKIQNFQQYYKTYSIN